MDIKIGDKVRFNQRGMSTPNNNGGLDGWCGIGVDYVAEAKSLGIGTVTGFSRDWKEGIDFLNLDFQDPNIPPFDWPVEMFEKVPSLDNFKLRVMISKRFKIGDKVRFTQKAKDRFKDYQYWRHGNFPELDLNKTYTVRSNLTSSWPACQLHDCDVPYIATYLLEPAETQKNKNMQKKDFILALVQAIFPNQDLTYEGCKPSPKVNTGLDLIDLIVVKSPKDKEGNVQLTLSPTYGQFDEADIELVTEFLDQRCDLDCPKDSIKVTDDGDLVMFFGDYPWRLVDEIKPLEQSPTKEQQIQALQAEIQQLKAENERLKAQTYTIEIPQGVTSIYLNLKG